MGGKEEIESVRGIGKESKRHDFKERCDINAPPDRCEVVKDIVAIANSGGGFIHFGVRDDGEPVDGNVDSILGLDPAVITDAIAKYTGEQFGDFELRESQRKGCKVALLHIKGVRIPMVFVKPGTYDVGGGKQKTAFAQGTVYFRHGAKSEPGIRRGGL